MPLLIFLVALFASPALLFLGGAFSGMVVGYLFPETFAAFLTAVGMSTLLPWQFGGMVGFVGSFFRSSFGD